jgi:hypothetical protein
MAEKPTESPSSAPPPAKATQASAEEAPDPDYDDLDELDGIYSDN